MQRLQEETALFRIAGDDQSRDCLKRPFGFRVAPRASALRLGREADQAGRVAVGAADMPFAWVGEDALDAGAEEVEIERGLGGRDVTVCRQALDPIENRLILRI